jgi:hypothetical protein
MAAFPVSRGSQGRAPRRSAAGWLALVLLLAGAPAEAASLYKQALIRRIFEGREIYIDQKQAKVADVAGQGSALRSGRSRAELLFDRRAIGLLGRESLILLGSRCFRLDSGAILVNGSQRSCLGSKVLGVRGTTYVLEREGQDGFVLSVLAGEARVGPEPPEQEETVPAPGEVDILSRFPTVNPALGIGASAFRSEGRARGDRFTVDDDNLLVGTATGLVRAEADLFLPLVQHEARALFYGSVGGNANFDGYGAVRAELGYRRFSPSSRTITGMYLAYGGFENPVCFGSSVNGGLHWEQNRWRLGAAVGVNADGCDNGLSYASLSLGIPLAQIEDETVHLSLTPYGINGAGDSWLGGRLALDLPTSQALTFNLYGSYDPLFRATVGGGVRWRLPLGGGFVRDPNPSGLPPAEDPLPGLAGELVTVREGEQASFDADGNLVGSIRRLGPEAFAALLREHQGGANPIPEGRRILEVARRLGVAGVALRELRDITAAHFVDQARPVSEAIDTPFWPDGIQPTLPAREEDGRQPVPEPDRAETPQPAPQQPEPEPEFQPQLPTDILIPGPPR